MSFSPQDTGTRIREAREARGLTQKQLADLAGIGKTAMFDLEHGNPGVRLNTLLSVLHILHLDLQLVDPEALVDPAPLPPPPPQAEAAEDLPDFLL